MGICGVKIHCKYDELLERKNLRAHPKNRNKHSEDQITRLAQILKYQGIRSPIVVSQLSNYVVKGHGTLEAFWLNGWDKAPVVYQDFKNEEQEYAYIQSDNAIALWAELDLSGINTDIGDLGPDFDIDLLGIKDFELEPADKFMGDEDAVPEPPKEAISRLGDLYQLGDHRLLCGDSINKENVERLMNGEKADMVFTDPPYGMNLDTDYSKMGNTGLKHRKVIGDSEDFNPNHIFELFSYCDEVFLFGADYYAERLLNKNNGSWIVWDKRSQSNEKIGITDGQFGSDFELCWSKTKHKREIARILKATGYYAQYTEDKNIHPTQKPITLIEWFFDKWGKGNNLIVDIYLGSGSTLIACEKTKRKCYGMEIDPLYCDVIIKRWEDYTGKKANKIG